MPEVLGLRELGGDDDDRGGDDLDSLLSPSVADGGGVEDAGAEGAEGGGARDGRWRRRAAFGVVGVLALGVGVLVTTGRPSPVSGGSASGRATAAAQAVAPVERAAAAALDAWARFASTGDVRVLADTFDPAGPQFARLKGEATAVAVRPATGSAFGVQVVDTVAGRSPDEQVVAADVVLSRPGEVDQHFWWELVMRRRQAGDGWVLWTVRERTRTVASAATGGAP